MQSRQQSCLRGSLTSELQARLKSEIEMLNSCIPEIKEQLAIEDQTAAASQAAIADYLERLPEFQQRKQTAEVWLSHFEQTLPSNRNNLSEFQAQELDYWSHEYSQVSHWILASSEIENSHSRQLQKSKLAKSVLNRRLEVIEWREETLAAFSNPAAMTSFPLPPAIGSCKDKSHDAPVCRCHIKAAFWLLAAGLRLDLKVERSLWHPIRFGSCADEVRDNFKRMAKDVSAVLAIMDGAGVYNEIRWC